jgi:AraC-like DNA-binding protein
MRERMLGGSGMKGREDESVIDAVVAYAESELRSHYPKTAGKYGHIAPAASAGAILRTSAASNKSDFGMPATKPLLSHLNRFRTRRADEARAFLGTKDYEVDFPLRDARQLDLRVNGAYLPGTYVGFYQFGTPIVARTDAGRHDYWINLPLAEPMEATIGVKTLIGDRKRGFIASPTLQYAVRTRGGGARLHVQITEARLNQQLTALLGEPPAAGPVVFEASIDLTVGYGRSIACYVMQAVNHLQHDDKFPGNHTTTGLFEDMITSRLLLSHPNNYSRVLDRLGTAVVPASIKRAVEFMRARIGEPVAISDVAAAAGIPGRTLFTHFQSAHGISPMQFLRALRFEKVRQVLLRAEPTDSVSSISGQLGFTHMGRFAVEYRRRFGETPSQTLAGARRRYVGPRV